MSQRIVIVGAGISGLSVAFETLDRLGPGDELRVIEEAPRPGGNVRTEEVFVEASSSASSGVATEGFRLEWAVNGFLDDVPTTLALVDRLGLTARLAPADAAAARRYLYRGGHLHALPMSPPAFLRSKVLSLRGRLRVLCEPLVPRRLPAWDRDDESVHAFATRRIGQEAADVLVDAMVSGIFAGNARQLSLQSAFPRMATMEREHGSLFRALLARRREAKRDPSKRLGGPAGPAGHLTSFQHGMQELTDALAARLGDRLTLGRQVERVTRDEGGIGYRLQLAGGEVAHADRLLFSAPAWRSAGLVEPLDAPLAEALAAIPSSPLAVVALGYRLADLGRAPDGFGFLVPRGQGLRALGVLFDSNLFPNRAPAGHVLLRAMIGGAHDPSALELDDDTLLRLAREAAAVAGVRADPMLTRVIRHARGIAQYTPGHATRLAAIEARLARLPGLLVSGASYRGVALNACVAEAAGIAARLTAPAEPTAPV